MAEKEYIEREAAIKEFSNNGSNFVYGKQQCKAIVSRLNAIPAADVRPVVLGKWKRVVDFTGVEAFGFKETMVVGWGCNVCGYEVDVSEESFNFCPNCGADMREES